MGPEGTGSPGVRASFFERTIEQRHAYVSRLSYVRLFEQLRSRCERGRGHSTARESDLELVRSGFSEFRRLGVAAGALRR